MKNFQFNSMPNGYLFITDEGGTRYYPSDQYGQKLDIDIANYRLVSFVSDGDIIYSIDYLSNKGLGWITQAIVAAGQIFSSVANSRSKKKEAEAVAKLQASEAAIQQQAAAAAERQLLLQSEISTGRIIGFTLAGIGIFGSILFLVGRNKKEPATKKGLEGKVVKIRKYKNVK